MNRQIFINPYEHFSERKLLLFGVSITLVGSLIAFLFNGRFDGVIDMHTAGFVKFYQPFMDNCINIVCLMIALYPLGWFLNRKTRIIDVLNAVLISRIPFYLLPLFNFNNNLHRNGEEMLSSVTDGVKPEFGQVFAVLVFTAVAISALILFVWWLYTGFRTATNCKKVIHKFLFAACIIFAEIVSKIIFSMI